MPYTQNPKDATRKLLEFVNEFGKTAGDKINATNLLHSYYTNNKRPERGIPIYHCIKKNRIPRNEKRKEETDLYSENCKTLMKEIKQKTR